MLRKARTVKFHIIHYGVETSESGADEEVTVLSYERWQALRIKCMINLMPKLSQEEALRKLQDPTSFVANVANRTNALYTEFNTNLRSLLEQRVDQTPGEHIVCLPFGTAHLDAIAGQKFLCVETGIGYPDSWLPHRIFESSEWMHVNMGKTNGQNYWFVCPNYYDQADWQFCAQPTLTNVVRFLGRIDTLKGLRTIVACAERMPDTIFEICGPGDPRPYIRHNVIYKRPLQGRERAEYLGDCAAVLVLSDFPEPFNGVSVEAQFCGTPVISIAHGALLTNVEHGRTGVHTHTLQDIVEGILLAQRGYFDRNYIRQRAVRLWSYEVVAKQYEYALKCCVDMHYGKGWYSDQSFLADTLPE